MTQKSESLQIMFILTLIGGFLDSYSYVTRGGVFAFAQTGNLVLLSINICYGNLDKIVRYIMPIIAFILGTTLVRIFEKKTQIHGNSTLETSDHSFRRNNPSYCRIYSRKFEQISMPSNIIRLRNANRSVSKIQRSRFDDDNVHRKFEKSNRQTHRLPLHKR